MTNGGWKGIKRHFNGLMALRASKLEVMRQICIEREIGAFTVWRRHRGDVRRILWRVRAPATTAAEGRPVQGMDGK